MNCPHCGTHLPIGAARCAKCGAPPQTVATGVLTPPVTDVTVGADLSDLEKTIGTAPAPAGGQAPPPGVTRQAPPLDLDVTRHGPDPGVTRMEPPTGELSTAGFSRAMGETPPHTPAGGSPTMFAPGSTLGTRYHVIRLLGVGGMGAVYHAWDAELGVAVALKVIRADIAGDPGAAAEIERQFKRELLLARQVTHKHVVRIHDLGDIDGVKYITMPYVKGADLATMLKDAGTLPIARTLRYVSQIVDGLVAAHDAGVVHRDLKPANIMIDEDDQALIMDFGIAHSSSAAGSGAGQVVGTLAYMAPEQAQAKPTDQRADVYALGMMLREMLVGRTASGDGQQALAALMQRIKEAPPALRTIDETIPEPLEALAAKCVEPDPASRFQTSVELAAALAALDENGHLRPVVRPGLSPWRLTAAAAAIVAAIGVATTVVISRRPPKPIDPVSILVADFDNKTGDAVFDGALEQPLTIAMEGASFVTSYGRSGALKLAQTLTNATKLDAASARPVAFREGIKYVLAGSVASTGGKFQLRVDAIDPATGKTVRSASATAANKGEVLGAVGSVAAKMRTGLGDRTSESAKLAASETFTAGSIDAMREYSAAQDLQNAGKNEDALGRYRRAIEIDPKFGRAYAGAANISFRLGQQVEAEALFKQALSLMDRMTDREKHRTLGSYYLQIVGNYEKAVDEYTALVRAYPSDSGGHANLAFAYFGLPDYARAMDEGRRAVETDPKNITAKYNLALYQMYAGDFAGAASYGKGVTAENRSIVKARLPVAVDAVVKGDLAAASAAYDDMATAGANGASLAAIGRADLALYAGRVDGVVADLKASIAADLRTKSTTPAAIKHVVIAEAELAAGHRALAIDAAHEALKLARQPATMVPAARVLLRAGKAAEARALAAELEGQLQKQNRAYGKIVLAEIALEEKKPAEAVDLLTQARGLADLWLGRFDLGVAYVQANAFPEAIPELELCEKRRGEATALFFDDRPTVRYLATLPYWIGRAQEGLSMAAPAKASYEKFLNFRKEAAGDPLVQDARRRLTSR